MFFWKHKEKNGLAPLIITIAGLIGMVDSFYLVMEYLDVLAHPGVITPCTVNSLVSCTLTVQGVWGHYFPTIPNPMLGMLWYAGCLTYGLTRMLGSTFSKQARMAVLSLLALGLLFSYRLYLASILELGGVCPFCLTSTTMSTLILLAFFVDDATYKDSLRSNILQKLLAVFQIFSVLVFVIGLPFFMTKGILGIPEPMEVILHWSFPVIVALVLIMAAGHIWAFKRLRR